jgi:hypothetical protein
LRQKGWILGDHQLEVLYYDKEADKVYALLNLLQCDSDLSKISRYINDLGGWGFADADSSVPITPNSLHVLAFNLWQDPFGPVQPPGSL